MTSPYVWLKQLRRRSGSSPADWSTSVHRCGRRCLRALKVSLNHLLMDRKSIPSGLSNMIMLFKAKKKTCAIFWNVVSAERHKFNWAGLLVWSKPTWKHRGVFPIGLIRINSTNANIVQDRYWFWYSAHPYQKPQHNIGATKMVTIL